MPTIKDEAVCIRHWDWSETSQTVSLFTRETGVLRGVAKGSKRENARFSGGLEILTRGLVVAIVKPVDGLATLTAWDLLETFPAIRRSLNSFYAAMYFADLVHHAVRDSDPHPGLYDALLEALRGLAGAATPAWPGLRFQWAALVETGFKPELARDVRTGGVLASSSAYQFIPSLGGFSAEASELPRAWRVRAETLDVLRSLDPGGSSHAGEEAESGKSVIRAGRLLAAYWREVLGMEPPSMGAYVQAVGRADSPDSGVK